MNERFAAGGVCAQLVVLTVRVLAKSFSELLHYFVKIRGVGHGHSFATQFADSIFQTTRWHQ